MGQEECGIQVSGSYVRKAPTSPKGPGKAIGARNGGEEMQEVGGGWCALSFGADCRSGAYSIVDLKSCLSFPLPQQPDFSAFLLTPVPLST